MKAETFLLKPLSYYYRNSTFLHIALIGAFAALGAWYKFKGDQNKKYNIKLIQSSVRVDVVAMPEFSVQELKSMQQQLNEPAPVEKKVVVEQKAAEPIEKDSFKVEKKKSSFSDMLKQYSKGVDQKVAKAKDIKKAAPSQRNLVDTKKLKDLVLSGNKLSQGESLVGGQEVTSSTEFQRYSSVLPDLVRVNWSIPSYLAEQELTCSVRIFINKSGRLIKAELYESSGNDEYDIRALSAVRKTDFPVPPGKISAAIRDGEILLGFPL